MEATIERKKEMSLTPLAADNVPVMVGSAPRNRLDGDDGNLIDGGSGHDFIAAGTGADIVHGGDDNDYIYGMDKDDILFGDGGNDLIYGDGNQSQPGNGSVAWTLYPDQGNDVIDGGEGNDYLLGQGGNDTLLGGEGNDSLWGDVEKYDSPPDPDGQDALDGGQDRQVSDVDFNYETSDGMFMRWLYCEMLRSNGKNDQNRNAFDSANDEFWLVAA